MKPKRRLVLSAITCLLPLLFTGLAERAPAQEPSVETEPHEHHHHGDARPEHGEHEERGEHSEHSEEAEYRHHEAHHDFSDAKRWSAMFDSEERREWQKPDEVVALMAIEPGMTAVDLGAGTGYFLGPLSAAVGGDGRVLALDVEANLIRFMEERAAREGWNNVEPRRIPFDDPELAAGSVDRVLIVNTWHHIAQRADYAAKLRRALKPGGRVYVVDFTRDSPSGPPVEERLEPQQVIDELKAGGLETELAQETLPRQYVVVGRRP